MFGFGNDKGNDKSSEKKRKYNNTRDLYIPAALSDTFGTCDPEEIPCGPSGRWKFGGSL